MPQFFDACRCKEAATNNRQWATRATGDQLKFEIEIKIKAGEMNEYVEGRDRREDWKTWELLAGCLARTGDRGVDIVNLRDLWGPHA